MRATTPATVSEPGFIALCIQLAQATFSEVMPPKSEPQETTSLSKAVPDKARVEPSWMYALNDWFYRRQVDEREAYLAKSTDIFDLERRIRALERRPYY